MPEWMRPRGISVAGTEEGGDMTAGEILTAMAQGGWGRMEGALCGTRATKAAEEGLAAMAQGEWGRGAEGDVAGRRG